MHDAIRSMLDRYSCESHDERVHDLREILQEVALLGLWRSKFFEHAAFYGGTALRVLHGLDRFSEDMDFSLLRSNSAFTLADYGDALAREVNSFGFNVVFEERRKRQGSAIESAFLKANTYQQMISIEVDEELLRDTHPSEKLKIRLEVDTDPPPGFDTETRYVLQPIPFAVRVYALPDLFAGKLHAVLCRRWQMRVKGRDWYDLVWYCRKAPSSTPQTPGNADAPVWRPRCRRSYYARGPARPPDERYRFSGCRTSAERGRTVRGRPTRTGNLVP